MRQFMDSESFKHVYTGLDTTSLLCWASWRFDVQLLSNYVPSINDKDSIVLSKTQCEGESWLHLLSHRFLEPEVKKDRSTVRLVMACITNPALFASVDRLGMSVKQVWQHVLEKVDRSGQAEVKRILALIDQKVEEFELSVKVKLENEAIAEEPMDIQVEEANVVSIIPNDVKPLESEVVVETQCSIDTNSQSDIQRPSISQQSATAAAILEKTHQPQLPTSQAATAPEGADPKKQAVALLLASKMAKLRSRALSSSTLNSNYPAEASPSSSSPTLATAPVPVASAATVAVVTSAKEVAVSSDSARTPADLMTSTPAPTATPPLVKVANNQSHADSPIQQRPSSSTPAATATPTIRSATAPNQPPLAQPPIAQLAVAPKRTSSPSRNAARDNINGNNRQSVRIDRSFSDRNRRRSQSRIRSRSRCNSRSRSPPRQRSRRESPSAPPSRNDLDSRRRYMSPPRRVDDRRREDTYNSSTNRNTKDQYGRESTINNNSKSGSSSRNAGTPKLANEKFIEPKQPQQQHQQKALPNPPPVLIQEKKAVLEVPPVLPKPVSPPPPPPPLVPIAARLGPPPLDKRKRIDSEDDLVDYGDGDDLEGSFDVPTRIFQPSPLSSEDKLYKGVDISLPVPKSRKFNSDIIDLTNDDNPGSSLAKPPIAERIGKKPASATTTGNNGILERLGGKYDAPPPPSVSSSSSSFSSSAIRLGDGSYEGARKDSNRSATLPPPPVEPTTSRPPISERIGHNNNSNNSNVLNPPPPISDRLGVFPIIDRLGTPRSSNSIPVSGSSSSTNNNGHSQIADRLGNKSGIAPPPPVLVSSSQSGASIEGSTGFQQQQKHQNHYSSASSSSQFLNQPHLFSVLQAPVAYRYTPIYSNEFHGGNGGSFVSNSGGGGGGGGSASYPSSSSVFGRNSGSGDRNQNGGANSGPGAHRDYGSGNYGDSRGGNGNRNVERRVEDGVIKRRFQ
ncbi:UNVERIFIED_CONTAM: hypothetical protein HDU68_012716 [Siphonaria sp. JEL0065]|nr:hypothetical protein HDU68_012716 [Siphonaria sp. JEL0065]